MFAPRLTPCSACSPASLQSALSTKLCSADAGDEEVASALRRQPLERLLASRDSARVHSMGQRLSSGSIMATNVEKTDEGEEKTFVCAVSTGS